MADVQAPNYPTPNWDLFGQTIGDLPNVYRRAQQDQNTLATQDLDLRSRKAFANGFPIGPDGQPDWAKALQTFAQSGGDIRNAYNLASLTMQQADRNQTQAALRDVMGGGSSGTGNPAPPAPQAPPAVDLPPASAAGAMPTSTYAEPTQPGVTAPQNLKFQDSVQDLQQDAEDAGVPSTMISGERDKAKQAKLYANMLAGRAGRPLPYPDLGPVDVAARPGSSPHEAGVAADIKADDPAQQRDLIALAREPWRNIQAGADFRDPNHFQAADAGTASAAPQPAAGGGQGAASPLVPMPPLLTGTKTPQESIAKIDTAIMKLSTLSNPPASAIKALEQRKQEYVNAITPIEMRAGQTLVDPSTGQVRFQAPMTNPKVAAFQAFMAEHPNATAAEQQAFLRTENAPRSGIGMFIQRFQDENPNATSEEVARAVQGYTGGNAGATLLAKRSASLELAENEAAALIPAVKAASDAVPRTQYPTLNSVLNAASQGTGGENVIRLGIAVESLTQAYARALSPTGSPIAADKAHAHELLDKAWSQGQIDAALDQMQKEIDRAQSSLDKTISDRRSGTRTEAPASPVSKSSAGLPAGWTVTEH